MTQRVVMTAGKMVCFQVVLYSVRNALSTAGSKRTEYAAIGIVI